MSLKSQMSKCSTCYISATEKPLQKCARCKAAKYCSKECQKADWKNHKVNCMNNATLAEALKEHDSTPLGQLARLSIPDNISMYELDQRLEGWVKFHNPTLMGSALHALELSRDIMRTRSHVMYVKLAARPRSEHGNAVGKFFRVIDAYPVAVAEAHQWPEPWPASLNALKEMQELHASNGRPGNTAAAMVECYPLAVQTVPFGSIPNMDDLPPLPNWKDVLIEEVEAGRRFRWR
ncbi:hypothetical protein BKA93DRAFT_919748 [Sparassis latifolia]